MIYSDLNIHLCIGDGLSTHLQDDFSLECPSLLDRAQNYLASASSELRRANFMLFNQALTVEDIKKLSSLCSEYPEKDIFLTLLASPNHIKSYHHLNVFKLAGLSAITFHSYHQNITKEEYPRYARLASWADDLNLPILVDGSYGTINMYNINNLEFVACLSSFVKNAPIVIMHSGGSRVIEAMLLVESTPNLFLETSFTLPYYCNSSIENDLAFAYKKVGPDKVVYASDHPYIPQQASLIATINFFDKYKFSASDQQWILSKSFSRIFKS